jgi:hypothetical protein
VSPSTCSRSRSAWPVCRPYFDEVGDQASQTGAPGVAAGEGQLVQTACADGLSQSPPRLGHAGVIQLVKVSWGVVRSRGERPVGVCVPVVGAPRFSGILVEGFPRDVYRLDSSEMLEQTTQRQARPADGGAQSNAVETSGFPTEGGAEPVERAHDLVVRRGCERRFDRPVLHLNSSPGLSSDDSDAHRHRDGTRGSGGARGASPG